MYSMLFLFISGAEIFFIMFIVVMVFGSDKIPGIAKGLGKGMRQLKDATEDIKQDEHPKLNCHVIPYRTLEPTYPVRI